MARRRRRRPGLRVRAGPLSLPLLLLFILLVLPLAFGQDDVTSTTTTSTPLSTSASFASLSSLSISSVSTVRPSSSSSSTSTAPTSTASAWEVAPTVILEDENVTYNFTLNRTSPVFLARFANNVTARALGVIFNIGQLGSNASEALPKVIVTTADNYLPNDGRRSRVTGGNAVSGYNIGADPSWQVVWDSGFGNWTYGIDSNWKVTNYTTPVAPSLLIGRGINDDIIVDPTLIGGGNVTVLLGYKVLDTMPAQDFDYTKVGGIDASHPYFGDATATEALVFSPLRLSDPLPEPTYPNYTLPGPILDLPDWQKVLSGEESATNSTFLFGGRASQITFVVLPTSTAPSDLSNSAAAMRAHTATLPVDQAPVIKSNGTVWTTIHSKAGFRDYALVSNLQPGTNYTVWAVGADGITMSQPSWFVTKPASFNCPIMMPTAMCPGVAYASPLADGGDALFDIPEEHANFIQTSLQAFQVSVLSGACGRDRYSFVSSCADCYAAYREWLCRLVLPQCAGDEVAFADVDPSGPQIPFRVERTAGGPRNANVSSETGFPSYPIDYVELQPCINTCTDVTRRCPSSLQWNCPHRSFNANESYAFVGRGNRRGDGSAKGGWPATDVYGNRWCNGL